MATIRRFEELEIWQMARGMSVATWKIILETPLGSDYALRSQISRSCGSIQDNIAEGFERGGNKELINFLCISRGSTGELRSQFYRALDRGYIDSNTFHKLNNQCLTLSARVSKLIGYLQRSDYKGNRFRNSSKLDEQETRNQEPETRNQ